MITSKLPEFLQFVYQVQDFLTTSNCNNRGWALEKVEELPALRALKFSFSSVMCYFPYQLFKEEKKYGWMISLGYAHGGAEEVLTLINDFLSSESSHETSRANPSITFCPRDGVHCVHHNELQIYPFLFQILNFWYVYLLISLCFFVFGGSFSFFKKVKN